MARPSMTMSRASMDANSSEILSEVSAGVLGSNVNSIAYLVYANRGDPYTAGYKAPTTRDIPQVKLPRVEHSAGVNLESYLAQIRELEKTQNLHGPHTADGPTDGATQQKVDLTPLNAIPEPFFNENFQLDNPRVFDAVIGDEDSNMIQEKLSWYVDIVEAHLSREIARASTQFFAATAQFGAIEEQAAQTSKRIEEFSLVAGDQQALVDHYVETEELQRKLQDATKLCQCLDALQNLKSAVEEVESFISSSPNDRTEVLHKLRAAQALASSTDPVDFSRVTAVQSILERLEIAETQFRTRATQQYVNSMLDNLRVLSAKVEAAQQQEYAEQLERSGKSAAASLEIIRELKAQDTAFAQYQMEVDREVKHIIRCNVPTPAEQQLPSLDDSQVLARTLHALSPEEAASMSENNFAQLSVLFSALKEQDAATPLNSDILINAITSADKRLARVFRVRKDPATTLGVEQFLLFYRQVTDFCKRCIEVSGGTTQATEIQEFLVAQTKFYIHNLHTSAELELNTIMENDDWRKSEIPAAAQNAVDLIYQSSIADPEGWTFNEGSAAAAPKQRIEVESQTFLVAKCSVVLAEKVNKFLQLVCTLPSQHTESISFELIELMRTFNHKSHHLILGFGATKTAGLKHISVKNLVLCFESLRFLETLIQFIKKCAERHLPQHDLTLRSATESRNASLETLNSFDQLQQAYFDHRNEIFSKLVKLMSDKVTAYSRQISVTNWAIPAPQANKYMLDLVRQTTTVAHIAQEMMPPSESLRLVAEIYATYKPKLLEAFAGIQVQTVNEKRNVLRDLAYFQAKSESLRGAGNIGEVIYESVNGFVAPELSAEPTAPVSTQASSLDLPRTAYADDADTTLALDVPNEPVGDSRQSTEETRDISAKEEIPVEGTKIDVKEDLKDSSKEKSPPANAAEPVQVAEAVEHTDSKAEEEMKTHVETEPPTDKTDLDIKSERTAEPTQTKPQALAAPEMPAGSKAEKQNAELERSAETRAEEGTTEAAQEAGKEESKELEAASKTQDVKPEEELTTVESKPTDEPNEQQQFKLKASSKVNTSEEPKTTEQELNESKPEIKTSEENKSHDDNKEPLETSKTITSTRDEPLDSEKSATEGKSAEKASPIADTSDEKPEEESSESKGELVMEKAPLNTTPEADTKPKDEIENETKPPGSSQVKKNQKKRNNKKKNKKK